MKILTYYIAIKVWYTSVVFIISAIVIFFICTYLFQLSNIGLEYCNALDIFLYVLYEIPLITYIVMPTCCLLGSFMGLGILSQRNEIIIMRSIGYSIFNVTKGILFVAAIFFCIMLFLGIYIVPFFHKKSSLYKQMFNNHVTINCGRSLFLSQNNDIFIKAEFNKNVELYNIVEYKFLDNELSSFIYSKGAIYENFCWKYFDDVKECFLDKNTHLLNAIVSDKVFFLKYYAINPYLLNILASDVDDLNINQIFYYIFYGNFRFTDDDYIWFKFWQMLFQPLFLLLLMILAVPFSLHSARFFSLEYKLILGILIGFIFYILYQICCYLSLFYNLPLFFGVFMPNFVFMVFLYLCFLYYDKIDCVL